MAIQIENLVKYYPGMADPALAGVSLHIQPGDFFGLLGPNGAGKTTLISILCGLLSSNSGGVTLSGVDVARHPEKIKPLIGLVPQEIALYSSLSARENLEFYGRMQGLEGATLAPRLDVWLEKMGLVANAGRRISTFSGGMKRRANLIAGLLHEPSILILDEPTVGIDPQSRNLIYENLKALNQAGMTMVYTTHYLKEAEHLCSRVAILDSGRLIAEGRPDDLVRQGNYGHLEELFLALTGKQLRD